jgi:tRNA (guanine37-N1)-methyltransferase
MQIDIVTIFPAQIRSFTSEGIFRIAQESGIDINVHDLRNWAKDKHKTVDDRPFGGGAGMVMKVGPIMAAVNELKDDNAHVILTSPKGQTFNSKYAKSLSKREHLIILCGHYEGVDQRVIDNLVDEEISIGDYVLSGGEIPALVIVDALLRHIPGVLGNPKSLKEEGFEGDIQREYPQYTRPEKINGCKVPDVLLSGDHEKIEKWRKLHSNK